MLVFNEVHIIETRMLEVVASTTYHKTHHF